MLHTGSTQSIHRDFDDHEEIIVNYLDSSFETGDPAIIRHTLFQIARAHGMSELARDTGMAREALYRALGENGNPTLNTLLKVAHALGVRLAIKG